MQQRQTAEPVFVEPLRRPEIDSQPGGPVRQPCMLYRLARQHMLAASIPRNRFLGSINLYKYGLRAGICSRVKGWKIDSWNRLGNKYGIEVPMSHVHVKINFSYGIDSRNRCLSVHKLLQIRALVFLNLYGAQESMPRHQFRQPM